MDLINVSFLIVILCHLPYWDFISFIMYSFVCVSVQSVMCEFEPPSTHYSQDNRTVPLQESLGLPFYRHSHLLPRPTPIYIILKEKDLISYSIICHINWVFFFHFSRVIKEQDGLDELFLCSITMQSRYRNLQLWTSCFSNKRSFLS